MPYIADTFNETPQDQDPPRKRTGVRPRQDGIFAEAARTATKLAEHGFQRRRENLALLESQADRLADRDFRQFDQFVEQLQPLGLVTCVEYGPFRMPHQPYGEITRMITISLPNKPLSLDSHVLIAAHYVGTALVHYRVIQGIGMIQVARREVVQFARSDVEEVLTSLASLLAEKAVQRKYARIPQGPKVIAT